MFSLSSLVASRSSSAGGVELSPHRQTVSDHACGTPGVGVQRAGATAAEECRHHRTPQIPGVDIRLRPPTGEGCRRSATSLSMDVRGAKWRSEVIYLVQMEKHVVGEQRNRSMAQSMTEDCSLVSEGLVVARATRHPL